MNTFLVLILAATITTSAVAATSSGTTKSIKITDVAPIMKKRNLRVQQRSLEVFQARTNIDHARANLLPKLTIWSVAQTIVEPTSIFDKITDIAPFLVPANWFRLEENKILYKAELEGYRALRGNEIHTAKSLFFRIQFDQRLLTHVRNSAEELDRLYRVVETQERFGGVRPGTARDIRIRVLGLKEDEENLKLLIGQEILEFSYILGYKANDQVSLTPTGTPQVSELKPLNVADYESRMLSSSPERRQFNYFLSALNYVQEEIRWSFFGVSSTSRGVAGGIFDSIPITEGIFGSNSSMKIAAAQRTKIQLQKVGVEETLRRQLRNLVAQYNSDLRNFDLYSQRAALSRESNEALLRRAQLGEAIDALEFSENARNRIQTETTKLTVLSRILENQDKLTRLVFSGDYATR